MKPRWIAYSWLAAAGLVGMACSDDDAGSGGAGAGGSETVTITSSGSTSTSTSGTSTGTGGGGGAPAEMDVVATFDPAAFELPEGLVIDGTDALVGFAFSGRVDAVALD